MRVLILGASGMVGHGVLAASLAAPDVEEVCVIVRQPLALRHPRLTQRVLPRLSDLHDDPDALRGFDACFFCLGVSSAGMSEAAYRQLTYELTLGIAGPLATLNPQMCFIYVSGSGTDSSGQGRTMWARIKGQTENALLALPFRSAYMFRPGLIRPVDGAVSKTPAYRWSYLLLAPLLPLLHRALPQAVLSTREIGEAMLQLARAPADHRIVETGDIRRVLNTSKENP
ncbi:MAG: epimerase [Roseateles depolymerans]|uniref:Epimerase n=1 Tax=Roseateles depolymerans TaxID=76731 RepID=A0A2W5DVB8_9BURK|nr:MAG: epimerase [Roseateles depolymerans]